MEFRAGLAQRSVHGQDRALLDPEHGLFGVFDGLGGVPRSERAAELARRTLARLGAEPGQEPLQALVDSMEEADRRIREARAGATTATVARIEGDRIHYLAIGDSRLYLQHARDRLRQLTRDQGEGNVVDNCLGIWAQEPGRLTRQRETLPLRPGDKLLLVTDGITGDFAPDILSQSELESAIEGSDPQRAAERLVEVARKYDDRTALAVFLGGAEDAPG